MTEQTTAQAEQTPAPEAPPKQTLEDLYNQFNVGVEQQSIGAPPAVEPTPEPQTPGTDDVTAIRSDVAQLRTAWQAERQANQQREEEADLKQAINTLGTEAGIKGKESLLRGFLISKATEDQRLQTLWHARKTNPGAWKKAIGILADEVQQEFSMPNPQLEENQRAMEESQRGQSSTAPPTPEPEKRMMDMSDGEFQAVWDRLSGKVY